MRQRNSTPIDAPGAPLGTSQKMKEQLGRIVDSRLHHREANVAPDNRKLPHSVRLAMRVQGVDATPSSALIRQCFRGRTMFLVVIDQNLARAAFRLVYP
jgi:hypothetical protein